MEGKGAAAGLQTHTHTHIHTNTHTYVFTTYTFFCEVNLRTHTHTRSPGAEQEPGKLAHIAVGAMHGKPESEDRRRALGGQVVRQSLRVIGDHIERERES